MRTFKDEKMNILHLFFKQSEYCHNSLNFFVYITVLHSNCLSSKVIKPNCVLLLHTQILLLSLFDCKLNFHNSDIFLMVSFQKLLRMFFHKYFRRYIYPHNWFNYTVSTIHMIACLPEESSYDNFL